MLKKLWHGDLPLWFNFWVLGGIIGTLRFLLYYFEPKLARSTAQDWFYSISLFDAISLICLFIVWVVIWRSADKYEGAEFLAAGAKLVVILSVFIIFVGQYSTL